MGIVSAIWRPGARLFAAGSIGLIAVALLHTWGHFTPPPEDAATVALVAAMREHRFDVGLGMTPSTWDILQSLSLTMGVFLVGFGGSNLLWLAAGADPSLVRRAAIWNLIVVGALVAVFAAYRIAPPFVTLGVVWILFVFAGLWPRRGGTSG